MKRRTCTAQDVAMRKSRTATTLTTWSMDISTIRITAIVTITAPSL